MEPTPLAPSNLAWYRLRLVRTTPLLDRSCSCWCCYRTACVPWCAGASSLRRMGGAHTPFIHLAWCRVLLAQTHGGCCCWLCVSVCGAL
jgi:hypothetical protein